MTEHLTVNNFGAVAVRAIAQHLYDGALFVLIGRGPGIHSIIDRSGEIWTSETPVIGVMLRYLPMERARAIYATHCEEYGEHQRADILLHAFYSENRVPSRN